METTPGKTTMSEVNNQPFSAAQVTQELFFKLMGRRIEIIDLEPVVVELHATGEFIDERDGHVAGVYVLEVDPCVEKVEIAGTAIDAFHSTVKVHNMDAFEFFVVMKGVRLERPAEHECDAFTQNAVVINKVCG